MRRTAMTAMLVTAMVVMLGGHALAAGWTAKDALIRQKLDDTVVSFTFNDQPLEEAIDFLQTLGNVNIVLDRKQVEEGMHVTLKLNDVPLSTALSLAADSEDGSASKRLHRIARLLAQGATLSEAMRLGFEN